MNLKPFITAERVLSGLRDGPSRSVLQQLIQPLIEAGNVIANPDGFLDDLEAREEQVTTVMENGVAFPHARSAAVLRLALTVGLAGPAGVHFTPAADLTSRLFFCIAVPAFAPTSHIPILQALASFARDPQRVDRLFQAKTPAQVARALANYRG